MRALIILALLCGCAARQGDGPRNPAGLYAGAGAGFNAR